MGWADRIRRRASTTKVRSPESANVSRLSVPSALARLRRCVKCGESGGTMRLLEPTTESRRRIYVHVEGAECKSVLTIATPEEGS